jgi:nicotinate-nucleotide--dimethylbenzimidazole phosphoribosyltransferase
MTDHKTFLLPAIEPTANAALAARLQHKIDQKTKPLGALGQLETLALQLGLIQRSEAITFQSPQMVVFAADHGIASEGVSAFPQAVTVQMVGNMLAGGAAINVFARQHGFALQVVDAGVAADLTDHPQLQQRKIAPGTQNICEKPAMSLAQAHAALQAGMAVMQGLPGNVVAFGEMGIANTSPAALLLARLAGLPVSDVVGRGTGLDDAQLAHKQAVLQRALARHADVHEPLAVLAALGGFEIAMMTGAMLQAASERRVVLVDGFIAGAAALVARALVPQVQDYLVFCHRSAERGHHLLLAHLKAVPLLNLDMRLGEGTGALLAWPLLQSAALFMAEMASFDSAGVSGKAEAPTLVTACTSLPPEGALFALGRPGGET